MPGSSRGCFTGGPQPPRRRGPGRRRRRWSAAGTQTRCAHALPALERASGVARAATSKIVDRCVHPGVQIDPLSSIASPSHRITARSARARAAEAAQRLDRCARRRPCHRPRRSRAAGAVIVIHRLPEMASAQETIIDVCDLCRLMLINATGAAPGTPFIIHEMVMRNDNRHEEL